MEPQFNAPQPLSNVPVAPVAKAKANDSNKMPILLIVILGVIMVGGLIYTNLQLMQSTKKVNDLKANVGQVSERTGKLEAVSKKGATDELLGFDKVDKNSFQSVFINGGQVYFGKITSMTTENIVLEDIYYLRVNGDINSASKDQSLVKLGCELHKPEDKMTIVRSSVQFWENLKSDGEVAKAIATYKQQNPNGQKCDS